MQTDCVLDAALSFTPEEIAGIAAVVAQDGTKIKRVDVRRDRVSGRIHVRSDAGWGTRDTWVNADGTTEHDAHL